MGARVTAPVSKKARVASDDEDDEQDSESSDESEESDEDFESEEEDDFKCEKGKGGKQKVATSKAAKGKAPPSAPPNNSSRSRQVPLLYSCTCPLSPPDALTAAGGPSGGDFVGSGEKGCGEKVQSQPRAGRACIYQPRRENCGGS